MRLLFLVVFGAVVDRAMIGFIVSDIAVFAGKIEFFNPEFANK